MMQGNDFNTYDDAPANWHILECEKIRTCWGLNPGFGRQEFYHCTTQDHNGTYAGKSRLVKPSHFHIHVVSQATNCIQYSKYLEMVYNFTYCKTMQTPTMYARIRTNDATSEINY